MAFRFRLACVSDKMLVHLCDLSMIDGHIIIALRVVWGRKRRKDLEKISYLSLRGDGYQIG